MIDYKSRQRIIEEKRNRVFLDTVINKMKDDKKDDGVKEELSKVAELFKQSNNISDKEITKALSNNKDVFNNNLIVNTFILRTLKNIQDILLEMARQLPSTEDIKNLSSKKDKKG